MKIVHTITITAMKRSGPANPPVVLMREKAVPGWRRTSFQVSKSALTTPSVCRCSHAGPSSWYGLVARAVSGSGTEPGDGEGFGATGAGGAGVCRAGNSESGFHVSI